MSDNSAPNIAEIQENITQTLHEIVDSRLRGYPIEYRSMIEYQLGLDNLTLGEVSKGKRLRPLFVILAFDWYRSNWHDALPAAAAVELLHNFSLVHDDIQDASETRRGRDSVWRIWGVPQAINAGDALLNLSYLSIHELKDKIEDAKIIEILFSLQNTCLELTRGQHLDMAFEQKASIPLELYWQMINGKTASLLSSCFKIGAIVAGANDQAQKNMADVGRVLGLAFQIQDDYLGIWGDEKLIGKSIYSDLISRKKTYPIILGIEENRDFASMWLKSEKIGIDLAREMKICLEAEGIREKVVSEYQIKYSKVFGILRDLSADHKSPLILQQVIRDLENRTR